MNAAFPTFEARVGHDDLVGDEVDVLGLVGVALQGQPRSDEVQARQGLLGQLRRGVGHQELHRDVVQL